LESTAPEHEVRYVPTGVEGVAVVEHVGAVVSEDPVSPFTRPEYDAVMLGTVPP
jgi:hypothetical protein